MEKTVTKTMLLVMIAIVSILMMAQIAKAASLITGSKHDLSTTSGPNVTLKGGTDICVYCHAPHAAMSSTVPLWNRSIVTTGFTAYSSSSLDATVGQPGGVSSACLSCHDGSVGVDAYATHGVVAAGTGAKKISGAALLGTDLSNDHPISFTYDAALVALDGGTGLTAPVTGAAGKITVNNLPLYGGKMECASCHNVHDNTTAQPFLRVSNTGSGLCLKCHIK